MSDATTMWSDTEGFLPQSVPNPLASPPILTTPNPSSNFPTTGANGLFFDLKIAGATAADVITTNGSSTVSPISGSSNVKLELTPNPGGAGANVLRVMLSGPSDRSRPSRTFSPTTFRLSAGSTEIYSFTVNK